MSELDNLLDDENVRQALRTLAERREHRDQELCPRCVKRYRVDGDMCRECLDEIAAERRERRLRQKREWWHRNKDRY